MGSLKTLELPESMDISKVSGFHSILRDDISQGDEVIFDATNVELVFSTSKKEALIKFGFSYNKKSWDSMVKLSQEKLIFQWSAND